MLGHGKAGWRKQCLNLKEAETEERRPALLNAGQGSGRARAGRKRSRRVSEQSVHFAFLRPAKSFRWEGSQTGSEGPGLHQGCQPLQKHDPEPLCSHGRGYPLVSWEHTARPQVTNLQVSSSSSSQGRTGLSTKRRKNSEGPGWQAQGSSGYGGRCVTKTPGFHTNYSSDYEHVMMPQRRTGEERGP